MSGKLYGSHAEFALLTASELCARLIARGPLSAFASACDALRTATSFDGIGSLERGFSVARPAAPKLGTKALALFGRKRTPTALPARETRSSRQPAKNRF